MKRFYLLLAVVAIVGGAAIWYAASAKTGPGVLGPGAPMPVPAADGFSGFTLGSDSAPVEVVEYADFECPACAQFAAVQMPTIKQQLIATGKVRWRFRDFPLDAHPYARYAAHAAHCAADQGRFWEMHDQLFYNHAWAQTGKNPSGLFRGFARNVGLDVRAYDECMEGGRYAGRIEASRREGEARNVQGTPTFFINGRQYYGSRGSDAFRATVDSMTARGR